MGAPAASNKRVRVFRTQAPPPEEFFSVSIVPPACHRALLLCTGRAGSHHQRRWLADALEIRLQRGHEAIASSSDAARCGPPPKGCHWPPHPPSGSTGPSMGPFGRERGPLGQVYGCAPHCAVTRHTASTNRGPSWAHREHQGTSVLLCARRAMRPAPLMRWTAFHK